VVEGTPLAARAYHPAGMADRSGFCAMGADEILVHTHDIASGLALDFVPPADLCAAVVARLFPWAPSGEGPWATLLWCNGRHPLGGHDRLDPNWGWHCAPLSEWDRRSAARLRPPRYSP
jgi:hypothetical protein